ncbi:MAG: class I SAM-dependent methyltransferase [Acidimicrobiales bacterium]|nr:class I SAM-dependent methyltransferase [Acidimicrobiales bacterium]
MDETPTDHFGADIAAGYDAAIARRFHEDDLGPTVDFLADLAAGRPALELGIGTGRVALPLAGRGVRVAGIDLSPAMVDKLREKPGGAEIDVEIGDFATTTVDGPFGLVFLVFSTISNLTTQDAQVACFRNAAAHLESGGHFVIEVGVPDLRRLPPGERARCSTTAAATPGSTSMWTSPTRSSSPTTMSRPTTVSSSSTRPSATSSRPNST